MENREAVTVAATSVGANAPEADELQRIRHFLEFVAEGGLPSREVAVGYHDCRSRLLASPARAMLPGFLYQCGTIDRFKEFIHLYDPDPGLRREFIGRMIARALMANEQARDTSRSSSLQPSIWEF